MTGTSPTIDLPGIPGGHMGVHEAGLPQGSLPGQLATASGWNFTIRADDGVDDLTIGGLTAIRDGVFTPGTLTLDYGRLSVTRYDAASGEIGVTFTLTAPIQNAPGAQMKYGELRNFDVILTDRDGDLAQSRLVLQIRDDEAVRLSNDSMSVTAGAEARGNLITDGTPDSFGADGFGRVTHIANAERTVVDDTADTDGRFSLAGRFGVLTVSPSGTYAYTAAADAPEGAVDRFTYFAADADGDEAAATITFTVGPRASSPGEVGGTYTSPGPGSTVTGGAGDDTLNASQGADVLTGSGGHDSFAFAALPWRAGHVTDFAVGSDRLDLSGIFASSHYSGEDPVADGQMRFDPDGAGGTKVYFDPDAPDGGEWPFHITTLDGVAPAGLTWAKLAGGGKPSSGGASGTSDEGQRLVSPGAGSTLTGGAGADTLVASQGQDMLTGAGGGDHFEFPLLPWNAGHVTDFDPAHDRIDLSALFDAYPQAMLEARSDGTGGTEVYFDRDREGGDWPFLITRLDGVAPDTLGADWVIR